jgi:hypothetical protein
VEVCPQSYVTPRSLGWIERFVVWQKLGQGKMQELSARDAEAFLILLEESKDEHA